MTNYDFIARQPDVIAEWFCAHEEDDGDFFRSDGTHPAVELKHSEEANRFIYATKSLVVTAAAANLSADCKLGIITCCGLPTEAEANRIANIAEGREIMFLGDMDPADLMIFGWLRARLHPLSVTHLGINEDYVDKLDARIPPSYRIALGPTELDSLGVLKAAVPDINTVIGAEFWRLLNQGYKIEVEAVVTALGSAATILLPALR